ncbi:PEP-CTERM sorting domain-containing protein [Cerasicoccus frondis]|uniref:PEP-CTERM sorting domain-containing protein n=1 Tax=Cerasicoccus frondis TaxID=490090 RepID=UPI002852796D|nr:PEP-CTERM sorting domain-containing protein [Cerasicoccus frondis]
MKLSKNIVYAGVFLAFGGTLTAQTLYWDTNGATEGAGNPADGTWDDTITNWSTSADGDIATSVYSAGADVIFSAGSDADTAAVTITGTQLANTLTFKNGAVTLTDGILDNSAANGYLNITVNSGASATINTQGNFNSNFNVEGTLFANAIIGGSNMSKTGSGTATFNRLDAILSVDEGTVVYTGTAGAKLKNATVNNTGTLRLTGNAFDGTKRNLTINTGGTVEFATAINQTVSQFQGGGHLTGVAGSSLKIGGDNKTATFDGSIDGQIDIISGGTGSFTLSDSSSIEFTILGDGENNSLLGDGNNTTTNINGTFSFNLDGADLSEGNSWLIVDVDALNETFGGTFNIASFTDSDGVWSYDIDSGLVFNESTGMLTYTMIPEPGAYAIMLGVLATGLVVIRRRRS